MSISSMLMVVHLVPLADWDLGWVIGCSDFYGITTNLNTKLIAILSRYTKLVCESDSQTILSLILSDTHHLHPYAPIINNIRLFMN
ncbi:hypothetical protein CR513_13480, partial [Mucuna pruriens]